MKRYCFTLDLINSPQSITEYENWHKKENAWPEIMTSIKDAGIKKMEIYRVENRLFMIMETDETFSFERKAAMDEASEKVQEWEKLMWNYQQQLQFAKQGEKWVMMKKIFEL